jgi:hypothetical protein
MEHATTPGPRWWGEFDIPVGTMSRWRVGPMTLWMERLAREWRIAMEVENGDDASAASHEAPCEYRDLMAMDKVVRIGTASDSTRVALVPLLADRPVVTRPIKPFYVAPGERLQVFVGSPLWLRVDSEAGTRLHEFPIVRPSDTWFGDNTMEGELCYASRTQCRLHLEQLSRAPHRALTAVTVDNQSGASLLLERMKLPVQYLPLYYTADGTFSTRDVEVTHQSADGMATVRHRDVPSALAGSATLVSPPRATGTENLVMKVFSTLFS